MKHLFYLIFVFSITSAFGQSTLTEPETNCKFVLPWTCETCTFSWTGDCVNNAPTGSGVLAVFNEGNEIMRYEGEMKNGKFDGAGKYRDGMNQLEGDFENGVFISNNPFVIERNARLDTTKFNKTTEWEDKAQVSKQMDNFYFTFPASGYAYENRDRLVEECLEAFKQNCALIHDPSYTEFTKIHFVKSENEVLLHANIHVKNMADIQTRSIYMVVSDEEMETKKTKSPPIVHEVMHMVSMTEWGIPPSTNNWLNEGLATYAQNNCSGYTVAELYRYFLEKDMLIPIDSLTNHFPNTEEMVSYHQSACIVEYLISTYGITKFEDFWKGGFQSFESIYGVSFAQMQAALHKQLFDLYPVSPTINWETIQTCE